MEDRITISKKVEKFINSLKRHRDCVDLEIVSDTEMILYYEEYSHAPIKITGPNTFRAKYRQNDFAEMKHLISNVADEELMKYSDQDVMNAYINDFHTMKKINEHIINQIKEPYRTLMHDRYINDIPMVMLAKLADMNGNTLKTRIRKGQRLFAHVLHRYFPTITEYKLEGRCQTLVEELNEIFINEANATSGSKLENDANI